MMLVVVAALLLGAVPLEQEAAFAAALEARDQLDYDRASRELERMAREKRPAAERATLFVWLGIARAENNAIDDAKRAFRAALTADAAVVFPHAVSPKLAALFESMKAEALQQEAAQPALPPAPARAPAVEPRAATSSTSAPSTTVLQWPWATAAATGTASVLALGVGVGLGVWAQVRHDDAARAVVQREAIALRDEATTAQIAANALFATSAVAGVVATGIVTWALLRENP